jgi:hypothetical protein
MEGEGTTSKRLSEDRFAIVVRAFYRKGGLDLACWRGRLARDSDGERFDMTHKSRGSGYSKPHVWCDNCRWCFLTDLQRMIGRALHA